MARLVEKPTLIEAAGNKPKLIEEFIGRVNTRSSGVSVARMKSAPGWVEPGQTPEFDEYTLVLEGEVEAQTRETRIIAGPGQVIVALKGEWIRYSTPKGATYVAVCHPAFSPETVHRDAQ